MDTRQKLLNRLARCWDEFRESYAGLAERELLKTGVIDTWSVKDIIAHVTTWEEEALKHLPLLLQGGIPPRYSVQYGGIDAFNAQTSARKKDLPLSVVFRQQDATHYKLLEFIQGVHAPYLDGRTRFRHRLRLDTYGHYRKHAEAIRKWRSELRVTNDK